MELKVHVPPACHHLYKMYCMYCMYVCYVLLYVVIYYIKCKKVVFRNTNTDTNKEIQSQHWTLSEVCFSICLSKLSRKNVKVAQRQPNVKNGLKIQAGKLSINKRRHSAEGTGCEGRKKNEVEAKKEEKL